MYVQVHPLLVHGVAVGRRLELRQLAGDLGRPGPAVEPCAHLGAGDSVTDCDRAVPTLLEELAARLTAAASRRLTRALDRHGLRRRRGWYSSRIARMRSALAFESAAR